MHGKFILSIPLLTSTEKQYRLTRSKRISSIVESEVNDKTDVDTIKLVENYLNRKLPYCYPYNAIVGFVEIWIDFNDVLLCYVFNGDGRRVYNRDAKRYRQTKNTFYPPFGHTHGSYFREKNNREMIVAMHESLDGIITQTRGWNLVVDEEYYRSIIDSLDFEKLLLER